MSEHTKTPWIIDAMGNIWAADTKIADMADQPAQSNFHYRKKSDEEHEANARHIVKCVNYHDRLVEALRGLTGVEFADDCQECAIGQSEEWTKARALLAELGEGDE